MDPITLSSAAISIITPFIVKTGEAIVQKTGEKLWKWLNIKFKKDEIKTKTGNMNTGDFDIIKGVILDKINNDKEFKIALEKEIEKAKTSISKMTVINKETVEKQININKNFGDITM